MAPGGFPTDTLTDSVWVPGRDPDPAEETTV